MKLALIPPRERLYQVELTDYHLLLPEFADDETYRDYYRWRRACGDFLMLDNGACEDQLVDSTRLMQIAHTYMVNEVVIPDVLGDCQATLQAADDFSKISLQNCEFNYMAVLQGQTLEEFQYCADQLADMDIADTFAIPRHATSTLDRIDARAILARYLHEKHADKAIHLLGTNPALMAELCVYHRLFVAYGVRGVDTASPYYYTMSGERLMDLGVSGRKEEYFDCEFTPSEEVLLTENIATMKNWVAGR